MIVKIPINYEELQLATQTSTFTINGKQYAITIRKSTISKNCYMTLMVNGVVLCENKTCTCNELITRSIVDEELYPEWFYFSYITANINKNFNYDDLGKTLFLFYWDGDMGDLNNEDI